MHLSSISLALLGSLLSCLVQAHMQMSNPFPINSPLNPAVPEGEKDYSYTTPLGVYPCKGYHTQTPKQYATTYTAGQTSSITIAGTAVHGGGSCQISLSYDNGATFKVIKSIMGGCPITRAYDFTIPAFVPSGDALLAWTWFNKLGNREMYMDCAWVKVQSSKKTLRSFRRDTASFAALPNIFVANIPQAAGVTTTAGDEITFPYPGLNVQYGGSISASSPLGKGYSGNPQVQSVASSPVSVTPNTSGTQPIDSGNTVSQSSSSPPASAPTSSTSLITPGRSTTSSPSIATVAPADAPQFANITSPINPTDGSSGLGSCPPGTLLCPSPDSFALCLGDGTPSNSQPVASGTQCSNGAIIAADTSGACDIADALFSCTEGGRSFSACSNGMWINMGSVGDGTICKDGAIVLDDSL